MRIIRRIFLTLIFLFVGAAIWAAIYAQQKGFTRTWREMVEAEFAVRGYYVDIEKLTLGPFQGLLAEDVRFFQDPQRKRELAFVDNIILDLDLSDVMNRDLSINTLDVQDAKLTLPLTPGKKDSELLRLDRLSARLVVTESQIEVVRAQAEVVGTVVSMKGALFRSPSKEGKEKKLSEEEQLAAQKSQLNEIRRRLGKVQQVLTELEKFDFLPENPPRVEIEFAGDLADLGHLHADVRVAAGNFQRGAYAVEQLSLLAEYDGAGQRGLLKELYFKDAAGEVRMRGDWPLAERKINFEMESSADLPALMAAFWPNPRWGEVVFFSPPRLQAEGAVFLDEIGKTEWPRLPGEVMGELRSDRFGSRGAVFDGMEMQFAVSRNRYYVRNLRLDHKSGILLANVMYDPDREEGAETFQFQSELKLDPSILLPFVSSERTKRFVSGWTFDESSAVYFAVIGAGPSLEPGGWETQGVIDLRGFRRQNVRFDHLETEYDSKGPIHHFRNLRVERPEGMLTAALIRHDVEGRTWETEDLHSTMDLLAATRAVAPSLSKSLEAFQFSQPPIVTLNGLIESREASEDPATDPAMHDFELKFESDHSATFDFLGRPLPLERPSGTVRASGGKIRVTEFQADLFGGKASASFETERVEKSRTYSATMEAEQVAFDELLRLYGNSERKAGGNWTGEMSLKGRFGEPRSVSGKGEVTLSDGDLLAMPMFSPAMSDLAKLLDREPEIELDPASVDLEMPAEEIGSASAELNLKNGVMSVSDLEGTTGALKLSGFGDIDGLARTLDFELSAETPTGWRMVFKGEGALAAPEWHPRKLKSP